MKCENCNKEIKEGHGINLIFCIGVPGHPDIMPLQCEHNEHWSCCFECFESVGHNYVKHMRDVLEKAHDTHSESILTSLLNYRRQLKDIVELCEEDEEVKQAYAPLVEKIQKRIEDNQSKYELHKQHLNEVLKGEKLNGSSSN